MLILQLFVIWIIFFYSLYNRHQRYIYRLFLRDYVVKVIHELNIDEIIRVVIQILILNHLFCFPNKL